MTCFCNPPWQPGDKYLCDSHSVPDWPAKAREINKKYEDDCVEHLCKMAKEGTWSWQKQARTVDRNRNKSRGRRGVVARGH